jgi:hypothetical protein
VFVYIYASKRGQEVKQEENLNFLLVIENSRGFEALGHHVGVAYCI